MAPAFHAEPKFTAVAYHVYRKSDGAILLSHRFVRLEGTPHDGPRTERELIDAAVQRFQHAAQDLAIISRDAAEPIDGTIERVDPKTHRLVITQHRFPHRA
jgi:hypothetical protein